MLEGVRTHHTGFVVRDLEVAVAFYRDVVGFEVDTMYERTGAPISQVVGYENAHLKIAYLSVAGGHFLELIQYVNPVPKERATEGRSVLGAAHLGLRVSDIEAAFQKLVDNGALPVNRPAQIVPGRKACYLNDADGNWIELLELDE